MRLLPKPAIWTIILLLLPVLPVLSCGSDDNENAGDQTKSASSGKTVSAGDRAARLAAQTQLRNAQTAQEVYYVDNQIYASSAGDLAKVDKNLSPRVEVTHGDSTGFEISIEAADSAGSVFIIRKTPSRIEYIDGDGNSW